MLVITIVRQNQNYRQQPPMKSYNLDRIIIYITYNADEDSIEGTQYPQSFRLYIINLTLINPKFDIQKQDHVLKQRIQ
ncbi:hypothetical protein FGO68_gene11379 [Halteria grandinella]|uniref:Uncharacterized protein n=1 Tax=Halteria grandinella TaxID=5974 RepID=A0A8J8NN03_HALGN|nr:hypothetical protein FGO68_gene11379 [Halteria grandinella]